MDLMLAAAIFASVFVWRAGLLQRSRLWSQKQSSRDGRRLTGRADEIDDQHHAQGSGTMKARCSPRSCKINLLRNLEETMWQAGIYMARLRHPADHRVDVRRGIVRRRCASGATF